MRFINRSNVIISWGLILLFVLTGCGHKTLTPKPTPAPIADRLELTVPLQRGEITSARTATCGQLWLILYGDGKIASNAEDASAEVVDGNTNNVHLMSGNTKIDATIVGWSNAYDFVMTSNGCKFGGN